MCIKKCAHEHTGSAENTPASPTQWLYGLYDFVLVTGFLATIIIGSFRLRQLDASTGASGGSRKSDLPDGKSDILPVALICHGLT
jgi:hypothetical protein